MKFTKEQLEKAKAAKTAEELLELAKAEGVEMSAEEAEKAFAELHKSGELTDEELDNVAGGACVNPSPNGEAESEKDVKFLYHVGQTIELIIGYGTKRSVIEKAYPGKYLWLYFPYYDVREVESKMLHEKVRQDEIQIP